MGGRQFAQYNKADPAPVVLLLEKRPLCFGTADWRLYLLDVHRGTLNDPANRQRLVRGELPAFCAECTEAYRTKMEAQGKCHPPALNEPVGGHAKRPESAARAADRASAEVTATNSEQKTVISGLLTPAPTGNAPIGFCAPASVFALAGCMGVS